MKKIILLFVVFLISITNVYAYTESYVVMDAVSGRILNGKNIDDKHLIASTTKIMTAIIAIENCDLSKVLTVGDEIQKVDGSMVYLKENEKIKLYDLLFGLLYRSGNDASMTIATKIMPYDTFILLMNKKALELDMKNTKFENPHGLDDETKNISTARDLSILMRYAMNNEVFKNITGGNKHIVKTNITTREWYNKNKLLSMYKYANGGKIGYTNRSKHVFVSSSNKGKEKLIVTTIKDTDRFNTHKNLYEKYFKEYDLYEILNKYTFSISEDYYKKYHLYIKNSFSVMLNLEEKDKVKLDIKLKKSKRINNNDIVGCIYVYVGDELVHKEKIYALKSSSKKKKILDWLCFWR